MRACVWGEREQALSGWKVVTCVVMLLLAACAPQRVKLPGDSALLTEQTARERALASHTRWNLTGHLGVSNGPDGGSGTLTWQQDGEYYDFELRAPVTGRSFRLRGGPQGAVLEGLAQGRQQGADAETLMHKAMGWDVPLAGLRAWVLGLRAPGEAELAFGVDRLPALLRQDGWRVEYRAWDTRGPVPLPRKIFAERKPYKVRLVIDAFAWGTGRESSLP